MLTSITCIVNYVKITKLLLLPCRHYKWIVTHVPFTTTAGACMQKVQKLSCIMYHSIVVIYRARCDTFKHHTTLYQTRQTAQKTCDRHIDKTDDASQDDHLPK